ncbi:gtp-binding protein ypt1 [Anaeramoeba ignava]|uniref:Gtp-binding protein ypt1 n=1 Tax=Anaeramoeba ignava TaxID=1746090 RepID=A0A9Q0R854_ANAIG|nr:gtp-binding protein ypt1 [Anaeramoeba ignava]
MNPIFKDYDYLYKIFLVGDSGVGKSCLILRYCDETYTDSYISTIGVDFKIRTTELNGKTFKLQIWDFHSSERYRPVPHYYYKGSHGILLFYDITDQQSFDNLKIWIKEIQDKADDGVNIMLIGAKSDLVSKRVIDTETGEKLAEQLGYSFFEISSKENINVDEAFESLINQIYQRVSKTTQQNSNKKSNSNQKRKKGCLLF